MYETSSFPWKCRNSECCIQHICLSVYGIGNTCKCHLYINAHQYLPLMLKEFYLGCDVMVVYRHRVAEELAVTMVAL